jgi:hypothetical protein
VAEKQKTVTQYICQDEKHEILNSRWKCWYPLYCLCESDQPNNHNTADRHSYGKICLPGKCTTVKEFTADELYVTLPLNRYLRPTTPSHTDNSRQHNTGCCQCGQ